MNRYKVRVHTVGLAGFFTQADHYRDYELESPEPFESFAGVMASKGFLDRERNRWILPGAIAWVEPLE